MKTCIFFIIAMYSSHLSAQSQKITEDVSRSLDAWHQAAASADFDKYFGAMTEDSRFIGTDASENWSLQEFKNFAKPYFDRGTAWDFKPVQRNIYLESSGKIAWFDELVTGWMKLCRGSGVLVLQNGKWKIKHYVLSMTIPNDNANEVIKIKQDYDDKLLPILKLK